MSPFEPKCQKCGAVMETRHRVSERDPRIDPKPGDALRKPLKPPFDGSHEVRRVTHAFCNVVTFERYKADDDGEIKTIPLRDYRSWAKAATVIATTPAPRPTGGEESR